MIDPNIWQSEDFSHLSILAKLVFIGMFSNADDEGRGRAKPVYLKSILFPYDEKIRVIDIETALSEIVLNLSVTVYSVGNGTYYTLENWAKWQTVEKPKPSQIPSPSEKNDIPRSVGDESATNPRSVGDESSLKEREEEREEKRKERESVSRATRFTPPTAEEVAAYCLERKNHVDPQRFVDFYDAKGWMVGKNRMKDWKAAVRTWEQRDATGGPIQATYQPPKNGADRLAEMIARGEFDE